MKRCLESVLDQADEVLVVDSGSPHGSAGKIAQEIGARFVRLPRNVGVAAGSNVGVKMTSGDLVGFLSDDAIADERWLSASTRLLDDPTVGAVAPRVVRTGRYLEVALTDEPFFAEGDGRQLGRRLTGASLGGQDVLAAMVGAGVHDLENNVEGERWRWTSGTAPFYVALSDGTRSVDLILNGEVVRPQRVVDLLASAGSYLALDGHVGDIGSAMPDEARLDAAEERFALSGTAIVTTREVWRRVGRFSPRYFAFYEDADWCWRARLMGLRMFFDPATTVRHDIGATSDGMGARRVRHLSERNRIKTLMRNAPFDLAMSEAWKKLRAGGDDGVADLLPRMLPRALAERACLRRGWVVRPRDVFERWAGLDVPAELM